MNKPNVPYVHRCLTEIAAIVLNETDKDKKVIGAVEKALDAGMPGMAVMLVTCGVNVWYRRKPVERFIVAATCYNRMDFPIGCAGGLAGQFPQTHLRAQ